jgi:A/G-specific adenine glycosylase
MTADVAALLGWYARERRDLPWRRTREPYRILVSEVMLQQTQASRVAPRYERFLARFPDERALAEAPLAAVVAEWSGLGYNRRAAALRAAVQVVVRDGWPRGAAGLATLPGVGPYTAAAVASFAFGEQVAAIDTNVRRVIGRLDGITRSPAALAARVDALVPSRRAAEFNQAMMELGATVCGPRAARCGACPLATGCASRGTVAPSSRRRGGAPPFEATNRYVRGRVVRALVQEAELPVEVGAQRLAGAVDGLVRDGLVVREGDRLRLA